VAATGDSRRAPYRRPTEITDGSVGEVAAQAVAYVCGELTSHTTGETYPASAAVALQPPQSPDDRDLIMLMPLRTRRAGDWGPR
jgi:hypothetical protein